VNTGEPPDKIGITIRTRRGCRSSAPLPRRVVTYARVQGFAKGAHPGLSCWQKRVPYNEEIYLEALRRKNAPLLEFLDQAAA